MERIGKPLAVLALGLAVSAAATPSFAQRSEEMSAVRAQRCTSATASPQSCGNTRGAPTRFTSTAPA
jgi:hypothetical protein